MRATTTRTGTCSGHRGLWRGLVVAVAVFTAPLLALPPAVAATPVPADDAPAPVSADDDPLASSAMDVPGTHGGLILVLEDAPIAGQPIDMSVYSTDNRGVTVGPYPETQDVFIDPDDVSNDPTGEAQCWGGGSRDVANDPGLSTGDSSDDVDIGDITYGIDENDPTGQIPKDPTDPVDDGNLYGQGRARIPTAWPDGNPVEAGKYEVCLEQEPEGHFEHVRIIDSPTSCLAIAAAPVASAHEQLLADPAIQALLDASPAFGDHFEALLTDPARVDLTLEELVALAQREFAAAPPDVQAAATAAVTDMLNDPDYQAASADLASLLSTPELPQLADQAPSLTPAELDQQLTTTLDHDPCHDVSDYQDELDEYRTDLEEWNDRRNNRRAATVLQLAGFVVAAATCAPTRLVGCFVGGLITGIGAGMELGTDEAGDPPPAPPSP